MTTANKKTWMGDLWERKVPQYLGTYLTVGFGLLQFVAFITNRYGLSEHWVDKYLLVWLAIIPAITTLIYFKGKLNPSTDSGRLKWPKFLILGNILIALLMGAFMFNGNTAQKSEVIKVTNEEGKEVKAVVPSLHKIKTVACFLFENLSGDKEQDWWGVAFSHLLQLNLDQRPEFYAESEYSLLNYSNSLGLTIFTLPNMGMQREIAQKSRSDYFSRISYTIEDNQFVFKGNLYSSSDGKSIIDINVVDEDPYKAIDKIKQQITTNIPNAFEEVENQVNLPASTLMTSNTEALQYFTQSRIAFYKDPTGLEEVVQLAKKAIELDPTCSVCQFYVGDPLYGLGQRDEAIPYLKNAVKYGVSLPERMQFTAKEVLYRVTDNYDDYIKLQEMRRKMFPYDFGPYYNLVRIYKANYGIESAKGLMQEAIENGNVEIGLLNLYDLLLENEEFEEAKKTLDRLNSEFPNRDQDRTKYATIYEKQGKIKKAKELLLEEETLDPLNAEIQSSLAILDFKNLAISDAFKRLDQGIQQATTLSDSLEFLEKKGSFLKRTGQIEEALNVYATYEKNVSKIWPVNRIIAYMLQNKAEMYLSTSQPSKVPELLEELAKYSPEIIAIYNCLVNSKAITNGYEMIMTKEEYLSCHQTYQEYGEGYGEYFEVMKSYLSEDYANCVQILDGDNDRVKKLFDEKYFLANVYAKAGKTAKAKEIVKKEIDQKTSQPNLYYLMALLLEKENKSAAKENLDIALQYWANADANYIPFQKAKALAERLGQ